MPSAFCMGGVVQTCWKLAENVMLREEQSAVRQASEATVEAVALVLVLSLKKHQSVSSAFWYGLFAPLENIFIMRRVQLLTPSKKFFLSKAKRKSRYRGV